jgi:hypothetical protein
MTVPGRVEAAELLLSLDPPAWFLRHSRAVAEIAGWLALRIARRGGVIDRRLVESAALLHDVDKLLATGAGEAAPRHGDGSATWLAGHGHPELRGAVVSHPVTRLTDRDWADRWLASAAIEERVVAYADKRAGQRLEPMAARFASWRRRYPGSWPTAEAEAAERRAARLERDVCSAAGITPSKVGRLSWTGPALSVARALRAA